MVYYSVLWFTIVYYNLNRRSNYKRRPTEARREGPQRDISSESFVDCIYIYIYTYIYTCVCVCVYIHIYIYIYITILIIWICT